MFAVDVVVKVIAPVHVMDGAKSWWKSIAVVEVEVVASAADTSS